MNEQASVWVVDDDEAIRFVLQRALRKSGFTVECFASIASVSRALDEGQPQVILTDIRLPDADGLSLLGILESRSIGIPVIAMTAFSNLDQAVSAFQKGVFEYLPKPFDLDQVISVVERAVAPGLGEKEETEEKGGGQLLGESPAMQEVFRTIGRLSRSDVSGARAAPTQPQGGWPLRGAEHSGDSGRIARIRAFWPRARIFHRSSFKT